MKCVWLRPQALQRDVVQYGKMKKLKIAYKDANKLSDQYIQSELLRSVYVDLADEILRKESVSSNITAIRFARNAKTFQNDLKVSVTRDVETKIE